MLARLLLRCRVDDTGMRSARRQDPAHL